MGLKRDLNGTEMRLKRDLNGIRNPYNSRLYGIYTCVLNFSGYNRGNFLLAILNLYITNLN